MKTPPLELLRMNTPLECVAAERGKQTAARGEQNHGAYKWLAILAEEFGEVAHVVEDRHEQKVSFEEYKNQLEYELIQVAAVAVAWIEAIRREHGTHLSPSCPCKECAEHGGFIR